MNIAEGAIARPTITWMLILGCLLGGLWGLSSVGRLEDPAFTLKVALVFTRYPGATAEEVEREVTEPLESAVQQMPQLKRVTSRSRPGLSELTVEIDDRFPGRQLPQIWDELRRRIGDARGALPPGAEDPRVNDDFGDVFGLFFAVTAPGFTDAERREIGRLLRREMLTVPGVVKVELAGLAEEAIFVEPPSERLNRLGLPPDQLLGLLGTEGDVPPTGVQRLGDRAVRIGPRPGFDTIGDIERLRIGDAGGTEQLSIVDIARVSRGEVERPEQIIRHGGAAAFTLAVAGDSARNIVEIGRAVDDHLERLAPEIPLGVEITPIYRQHVVVDEAIDAFIVNLALSVTIVALVLCLFMGVRVGVVVGLTLLLTVLGTLFFMAAFGIEMERISLGALVIAMGMLVDNAIVVAEGMLIGLQRGKTAREAAGEAAARTQVPLLGATVIGVMAFSGIGLSPDTTGEFLFSLFAVIAISLLLSWLLALTATPLLGALLLRPPRDGARDPYAGRVYHGYAALLRRALGARWGVAGGLVAITVGCFAGFGLVREQFFPNATTPLFYVHYFLPQGTDIRATERDMIEIERAVADMEGVTAVTTFVGRGASRFMLTYDPEQADSAYGHLIVRVDDLDRIDGLTERVRREVAPAFPDGELRTERLVFGPPAGASVQARFIGRDAATLRRLGADAQAIFEESGVLRDVRHDWRQREMRIAPIMDEERARLAGVGRDDVALTVEFATSGVRAGAFREGDAEIPIIVRAPLWERAGGVATLPDRLAFSSAEGAYVPLSQVVERFEIRAEEAQIHRRDRMRALTVSGAELPGMTAMEAFNAVRGAVEATPLPPGYRLEWGGEYEASGEAQESLGRSAPIGFLVMLAISVLLFGRPRQPLILWLIVPMSLNGVVLGLIVTGLPFTFTALLGVLSLSGMLMKNAIVLVDEIDARIEAGDPRDAAVVDASVSRLRPVMLAAVTTILGMAPLLADAFFASMAVTIMGGLAFATVLTLLAAPVFYALLFGIRRRRAAAPDGDAPAPA
ncbi:MAG: efflux RND transporter permease subunit [Rhodobacteraceae bacterium]|nr:MAG: efflux RND transporter permease subunit [Paracoccaceae bacterium]